MLKRLKWIGLGILIAAGGLGWFSYTRHVVRDEDGLRVVRKTKGSFQDIYVDVREWGAFDYLQHEDVRDALARAEAEEVKEKLRETGEKVKQKIDEVLGK